MDKKKRQSSIKRSHDSKDDQDSVVTNTANKRRISFSGKKHIREFCGEEEPKNWNNCYELSDNINISAVSEILVASNRVSSVSNSTKVASANPTNDCISTKQKILPSNDKENIQYANECMFLGLNDSSHYNTMELIDRTAQNDECKIENSADITLSETEKEMQRQHQLKVSSAANVPFAAMSMQHQSLASVSSTLVLPSITFYAEETEIRKLHGDEQKNVPTKLANNTVVEGSKNDKAQLNCQETLHCTDMDISQQSKVNSTMAMNTHIDELQNNTLIARRTDYVSAFMDESNTALYKTRDSLAACRSKTIQQTQDMDISMFATKPAVSETQHIIQEKENSYNFDIDSTLQARHSPKRRTTHEQLDLAQETLDFTNKLNRISLTEDLSERTEIQQAIPMNISIANNKCNTEMRKTINFNNDITCDLAPVVAETIKTQRRGTLLFKSDDACSQMDVTAANTQLVPFIPAQSQTPLQLHKDSTAQKNAVPKVVVVRKTCTPIMQKKAAFNDMEKRQMQRYQLKQQQQKEQQAIYEAITAAHVADIKNKSNIASVLEVLSPELSSPLLPPEFMPASNNKKLNFRQLNDAIEHGKIQINSNSIVPKTNTPLPKSQSKSFTGNSHCKAKQSLVLNFEDTMQFSPPTTANKTTKTIEDVEHLEVNAKPVHAQKRREFRYSQADDMLLDNTIFLTQAKLGDETASRNSSKCSTANKRDTMHFNEDLELDLNEIEAKRTALALASNLEVDKTTTINNDRNSLGLNLTHMPENQTSSFQLMKQKYLNTEDNKSICEARKLLTYDAPKEMDINDKTLFNAKPGELNNESLKLSTSNNNVIADANMEMDWNTSLKENAPLQDNISNKRQTIYAVVSCDLDEENFTAPSANVTNVNRNNTTSIHNDTIEIDCNVLKEGGKMLENFCNNTNNRRQTVYTAEPCELDEESVAQSSNKPVEIKRRETFYFNSAISEEKENLEQMNLLEKNPNRKRQTLLFTNDCNDILIDESFASYKTKLNNIEELNKQTNESFASSYKTKLNNIEELNKQMNIAANAAVVTMPKKSRSTMNFTQDNNSLIIDETICNTTNLQNCKKEQKNKLEYNADMLIDDSLSNNRLKLSTLQRNVVDCELSETLVLENTISAKNIVSALDAVIDESHIMMEPIKTNNNIRLSKSEVCQTTNDNMHIDASLTDTAKTVQGLSLQQCGSKASISSVVKPLNAAKRALQRQSAMTCKSFNITAEDSLILKLEETRAAIANTSKLNYAAPTAVCETKKNSFVMPTTPHRSIIEFEYFEREANLEQRHSDERKFTRRQTTYDCTDIQLDVSGLQPIQKAADISDMCMSPALKTQTFTNKRSTANLTPILPISKKRQTLLFEDYNLEESLALQSLQKISKRLSSQRRTLVVPSDMDIDQSNMINECDLNNKQNNIIGKKSTTNCSIWKTLCEDESVVCMGEYIQNAKEEKPDKSSNETLAFNATTTENEQLNLNEEIEKTPPSKTQASRIPILIDSAKKTNSILARFQSPNNLEPAEINCSLETIEMPRRATLAKKRADSILAIPLLMDKNDAEQTFSEQHKMLSTKSIYEDNAITISDVSAYYVEQRKSAAAANSEAGLNVEEEYQQTQQAANKFALLNDDNTVNNLANYKKNYANLTCVSDSSPMCGNSDTDDIEKTRLSLVETLLDDDEDDDVSIDNDNNENCQEAINAKCSVKLSEEQPHGINVPNRKVVPTHSLRNASFCRKCKRCQQTLIEETNVSLDETLLLPALPVMPDLGFERLRRLRKRPTITDVDEHWRRISLERGFENNYDDNDEDEDDDSDAIDKLELEHKTNFNIIMQKYKQLKERMETVNAEHQLMPVVIRESFTKRLDKLLSKNLPYWIFDDQMQYRQLLKFSHKKHLTFAILITYEEKDYMGRDIHIKSIERTNRRAPMKNWLPIDFILDFQLKLELPYDLNTLCTSQNENGVYAMLKRVNKICMNIAKMGRQLWLFVCCKQAALINVSDSIYVQKILREVIPATADKHAHVVKTEFRIEVTNMRKLSWKDITLPPLHMFREEIQFLPVGLDFLHVFLSNPKDYLKI